MRRRKILLAYDGSESAASALRLAVSLTRAFGAELHVLAVAQSPRIAAERVETRAVIERSTRECERALNKARIQLASEIFEARFELAVGQPSEQIVRYAEKHGIDHIVVGHRGRTFFERWLIRSVARQVIAGAHCAVTVVRQSAA